MRDNVSVQTLAEERLRALIQQAHSGSRPRLADDVIFASGLFSRPIIGRERVLEAHQAIQDELQQRRPNETITFELIRLVLAESGDLAYECGDHHIRWDRPDGNRTGFDGSYVRVWRNTDGEWLVAAAFYRPNDVPFAPLPEHTLVDDG